MTDEELVALIIKNDSQALDTLMIRYTRLLWYVAGSILKDVGTNEDIEECISDVFIELWRRPGNWKPKRGGLQTYLALLVKREALNRSKKLRRSNTIPLTTDIIQIDDMTQDIISKEVETATLAAVDNLPEPNREIFIRRHLLGQKPEEIAHVMKLPVRQITNRLYRSKDILRAQLNGIEQD